MNIKNIYKLNKRLNKMVINATRGYQPDANVLLPPPQPQPKLLAAA